MLINEEMYNSVSFIHSNNAQHRKYENINSLYHLWWWDDGHSQKVSIKISSEMDHIRSGWKTATHNFHSGTTEFVKFQ